MTLFKEYFTIYDFFIKTMTTTMIINKALSSNNY